MIISHRHKFVFLKTSKTAGTSIEIALSKFCGSNDVITPISLEDEEIRRKLGYRGPQNYLLPLRKYNIIDIGTLILRGKKNHMFFNHITAGQAKAHLDQKIWDSYFKFCFERNPWDKVISLYFWRYRSRRRPSITKFVESETPMILKRRGFEIYTIEGQVAVDKIFRYENLAEELETIRKQLGIPEQILLPHAKSQFRKEKQSYRDYFGEQEQARVADLFGEEINLMGYEF